METTIISVKCPKCSKKGNFTIEANKISQRPNGITSILIKNDIICSHSIVIYVDRNAMVRDCFLADFTVKLPEIDLINKLDLNVVPNKEQSDINLLTMNFNPIFFARVVRSCLLNQKILVINELEFLNNHINNFFEYLFKGYFTINITILSRSDYKKQKKLYNEHLILDNYNIIQDKLKMIKNTSIKVENKIVQKFIDEPDPITSIIILKNEIVKAFEISQKLINLLELYQNNEKIGKKILFEKLSDFYKINFSLTYLDFILDILNNYFKADLSKISNFYYPKFGV